MEKTHKLVLYNDDDNTYLEVMACLVAVCDYDPIQAEQCAIIADNKGRCDLITGDYLELNHKKDLFDQMGIHTSIKEIEKV